MSDERFVFPASYAQRGLWFVNQLDPETAHYSVPMALALSGDLDVASLRRALETVVARHEALRTTFELRDGEPVQVVSPAGEIELPVLDAGGLSDGEADALTDRVRGQPFDLERGPLLRALLVRRRAEEHVLVLAVHHIVFDGWSAGVLLREMSECYRAFVSGETPRLPELPVQYGDYAVWEREWLQGEMLERHLAYWRARLSGAPSSLELPTDRPRPRTRSPRGSTELLLLPPDVLQGLKALSRQEGTTLFMTLLAGFQSLLARYSGVDDITVGSPVANRTRSELEPLIGCFVNSLPLRTDLSGDPTFRELLGRVRQAAIGAFDHQDLPFEKLVEALQPKREGDRNPIFQVMFALQNPTPPLPAMPGLSIRRLSRRTGTSKFDLSLDARETAQGLALELEYSTDLFDAGTIRGMLRNFETLLEGVLADPTRQLAAIPLLGGRRLVPGSTASPDASDQARLETVLADHAGVQECVVTVSEDRRQGRALVAYVVPREDTSRHPVYASESPADHMSAWQVLREEEDRRRLMEGHDQPAEHLEWVAERLLRSRRERVIEIGCGSGELLLRVAPHCLRYVATDTSAAVLEGVRSRIEVAGLADRVRLLRRAPTDLSGFEREGAALIILGSWTRHLPSIDHLLELLESLTPLLSRSGAIFLRDVPCLELTEAYHAARELGQAPPGLASAELQRRLRRRAEAETRLLISPLFFNALPRSLHRIRQVEIVLKRGRTDDAVTGFHYDVLLHAAAPKSSVDRAPTWTDWVDSDWTLERLGRILRESRPASLALGRVPNARTAAHAWAATRLAGVDSPSTAAEVAAAARAAAHSAVEPEDLCELGETLGYRVELSWARCDSSGRFDALFQRAGSGAAAWPKEPRQALVPGQRYAHKPRLKKAADDELVPALRAHLRDRMPDLATPVRIVVLEALPRSSNGRLDHGALPPPAEPAREREAFRAPPRTPVEDALARLWQQLLGVPTVGPEDNFFELGGHSLLAVRLFAEVERMFGRRLPLSVLYRAPSLGQLAEAITQVSPTEPSSPLAVLQPRGARAPLFLVHGLQGDVLEYRKLVERLGTDQPVYGLEAQAGNGGDGVLRTIEQLASAYLEEIRRQQPAGPYLLCGYCWAGALTFELAQQLSRAGEEVALLALIDAACPGRRRRNLQGGRRRGRKLPTRVVRGLARLRGLALTSVPRFLWDRALKMATELAGVTAFRGSARLGRPLLPAFHTRRQALLYAARSYRPAPYPGRLTLLRAWSPDSSLEQDESWGWGRVAAGGVDLHRIRGQHMELLTEPVVDDLADALRVCLDRVQGDVLSSERGEMCEARP